MTLIFYYSSRNDNSLLLEKERKELGLQTIKTKRVKTYSLQNSCKSKRLTHSSFHTNPIQAEVASYFFGYFKRFYNPTL